MAKKKSDVLDAPEGFEDKALTGDMGTVETVEHPDLAAARESIAERDQRIAELEARIANVVGGYNGPPSAFWKVALDKHATGRERIVKAPDPANAWFEFMKREGITNSENTHKATPATETDYLLQDQEFVYPEDKSRAVELKTQEGVPVK